MVSPLDHRLEKGAGDGYWGVCAGLMEPEVWRFVRGGILMLRPVVLLSIHFPVLRA